MLDRREFLGVGASLAASLTVGSKIRAERTGVPLCFRRRYAPHFGMFRHHAGSDALDQLSFLADEGFLALEDCGLGGKPIDLQNRIGRELDRQGMTMGLFSGPADFGQPTFTSGRIELRQAVLQELDFAIDTARRVGGRYIGIVAGKTANYLSSRIQMRNAVDLLQYCADHCERYGIFLLLEPIDHGAGRTRLFLQTARQAAQLCRCVGRPSCKVLFDVYQQSVRGEDLAPLLLEISDVVGYVQLADSPSRKEPGTAHVDFGELFQTLDRIGYDGILGMEHGNARPGREGERAVIDAYRALDRFSHPPDAFRIAARHSAISRSFRSKTSME